MMFNLITSAMHFAQQPAGALLTDSEKDAAWKAVEEAAQVLERAGTTDFAALSEDQQESFVLTFARAYRDALITAAQNEPPF